MDKPFTMLNGVLRFNGQCETTRPFCGAVCCKNTAVLLTEEEKDSGKYDFKEPTEGCDCANCQLMRQHNKVLLRRTKDGCVYLDGSGKCSIYEDRPQTCQNFKCDSTFWSLALVPMREG